MGSSASVPIAGDFVELRTRRWLVEGVTGGDALVRARLACIDDDAQGETPEVLRRDEVDASVVADSHLSLFYSHAQRSADFLGGLQSKAELEAQAWLRRETKSPGCAGDFLLRCR